MKFRAHDTFFIRKGWLSKGMKAVQTKPDVFVAKDENPMDVLGIGSNMVKALRYWLVATNLTEEAIQNKKRIQKFTDFGTQVYKNDLQAAWPATVSTICWATLPACTRLCWPMPATL